MWIYKWNLKSSSLLSCESESFSVVSDTLRTHGLYSPWTSPGQNTEVGNLSLLQGIFTTQGLNPGLLKNLPANAGDIRDVGSIPRSGRSPGERIGYLLQYSWASMVAQLVKNPPAMRETWIRSLGWDDPLENGMATHCSILAWRIPWTVWSMGSQRVGHDWVTFTLTFKRRYRQISILLSDF